MTDSTSLLGFTMQLPVQAQSTLIAQPWEPDGRARGAGGGGAGLRRQRLLLGVGVRPRRHPPGAGAHDDDHVVRHGRDAGLAGRVHGEGAAAVARLRRRLPPPAADGQGVRHPRRPVRRPGHPRRSGPGTSRASSTRWACRSPSAAGSRTRPSWPSAPPCPTNGAAATSASSRVPCRPVARPSGWADRRGRPCAGPHGWVTAGCRKDRPRAAWPRPSPPCGGCATRPAEAGRSPSVAASTSTSASPRSTCPDGPSPANPTGSPGRCVTWWRSASTTSRFGSRRAAARSTSTRSPTFGRDVAPLVGGRRVAVPQPQPAAPGSKHRCQVVCHAARAAD